MNDLSNPLDQPTAHRENLRSYAEIVAKLEEYRTNLARWTSLRSIPLESQCRMEGAIALLEWVLGRYDGHGAD